MSKDKTVSPLPECSCRRLTILLRRLATGEHEAVVLVPKLSPQGGKDGSGSAAPQPSLLVSRKEEVKKYHFYKCCKKSSKEEMKISLDKANMLSYAHCPCCKQKLAFSEVQQIKQNAFCQYCLKDHMPNGRAIMECHHSLCCECYTKAATSKMVTVKSNFNTQIFCRLCKLEGKSLQHVTL